MRLVSWNCRKGLNSRDKDKKLLELNPDIAIIQESYHPKRLKDEIQYEEAIWVGEEKENGLGILVLSLSKDYQLSLLVEQVKYEWIVPIKVSGKENFTLIAVWTQRMNGLSYGNVLYAALLVYERYFHNGPVIIMGDFNLDKRVPSSYTGVGGYKKIMNLFERYGLESCYHSISKEEFGSETVATYYHYGKSGNPFHLDYCFVSHDILQGMRHFTIGTGEEYLPYSDHVPLVLDFTLSLNRSVGTHQKRMNHLDLFEELMIGDDGLLISLRMGDGLNKEKAQQVYRVLADLAVEWKNLEQIPKKAADLFMDIYPAMLSASDYYNEEVGLEIMDCCDQILYLVRRCVN